MTTDCIIAMMLLFFLADCGLSCSWAGEGQSGRRSLKSQRGHGAQHFRMYVRFAWRLHITRS